jgi:hypothetical protein
MKITKEQLINLIKEEVQKQIDESGPTSAVLYTGHHEYDNWKELNDEAMKEYEKIKNEKKKEIEKHGGIVPYILHKLKKKLH